MHQGQVPGQRQLLKAHQGHEVPLGNSQMPLTLEATNMLNIIKWWVDASFAVHPDMQSHTGAVMTLGCGAVSKGELVRVHKAMPRIL